jgi:aryl-alcohol dehydrogenase-like predicted oxidoreductase
MELRPLGNTGIHVSPIALGCWPIAGLASPGMSDADSIATIQACFDLGINHLDTAYCYGRSGESERLIGRALGARRHEILIATKGGLHWDGEGKQACDASPATLRRECHESLRRLGTDCVDLLYLHAPDPKVPVAESAAALRRLMEEGKTRSVGASNLSLAQLEQFAAVCPLAAFQPPYNMLQRQIEADTLPWCRSRGVAVLVYWPLMKGLLAGNLRRGETFVNDSRRKYPMFQGEEYQRNLDFVDALRQIAALSGHTVAQLVINWTIHRPGITSALCGAKRPEQLRDTAQAAGWRLSPEQLHRIEKALTDRGTPVTKVPV